MAKIPLIQKNYNDLIDLIIEESDIDVVKSAIVSLSDKLTAIELGDTLEVEDSTTPRTHLILITPYQPLILFLSDTFADVRLHLKNIIVRTMCASKKVIRHERQKLDVTTLIRSVDSSYYERHLIDLFGVTAFRNSLKWAGNTKPLTVEDLISTLGGSTFPNNQRIQTLISATIYDVRANMSANVFVDSIVGVVVDAVLGNEVYFNKQNYKYPMKTSTETTIRRINNNLSNPDILKIKTLLSLAGVD